MKNIERIAIDSMLRAFEEGEATNIEQLTTAKKEVEEAQQNFKKIASSVKASAQKLGDLLTEDGVSDEAFKYFQEKMQEITKIPFTQQK